mmetsp:Transcript_812/g.2496  ORF Transcript_812/g.2496 Transcript_812/m.2496 type:complete len:283 (+) Transcript_812:609-1457(+)
MLSQHTTLLTGAFLPRQLPRPAAQLSLRPVLWRVPVLVVDVHEAPLHLLQRLDLVLQVQTYVVRVLDAHVGRKDHLELHKILLSEEVRPNLVRHQHLVVLVRHLLHALNEVVVRPLAHELVHLPFGHHDPPGDHVDGDGRAPRGVRPPPPLDLTGHRGRRQGHGVAQAVVQVVLAQRQRAWALVPHGPAEQVQRHFGQGGEAQHGVGRGVHVDPLRFPVRESPPQPLARGLDDLDGADGHDSRADDHADGLQPGLPHRVPWVRPARLALREGDHPLAQDVHH